MNTTDVVEEEQTRTMHRRRLLQLLGLSVLGTVGSGVLIACGGSPPAPSFTSTVTPNESITVELEAMRSLSPYYLGYNAPPIVGPSWTNATFAKAVAQFQPGTLRYPGGTVANYWDWKTGWFLPNTTRFQSFKPNIYRLQELQAAVTTTGAIPVYVLNMLTSDLPTQMDMLRSARTLGLPVQYIELGNEFNLDENKQAFPTAQIYGKAATQWIQAIRAEFPDVRIAAVGEMPVHSSFLNLGSNTRRANWNSDVLQTLKGADALVMHPYVKPGLQTEERARDTPDYIGNTTTQKTEETLVTATGGAARVVSAFYDMWSTLRKTLQSLPSAMNIWFTEYNLEDRIGVIRGTWLHGILAALITLTFLEEKRTELVSYYDTIGTTGFEILFPNDHAFQGIINRSAIKTTPYDLTATGIAMREVSTAMHGMTSAQRMSFHPNPQLVDSNGNTFSALQGWLLSNDKKTQGIVINCSEASFTLQNNAALAAFAALTTYQQLADTPLKLITGQASMLPKQGVFQDALILPPYSLTHLQ